MASPLHLSSSRIVPVVPAEAFERTLAWPLPELFDSRHLAIPPIVQVDQDGDGPWGEAGRSRTIRTADGGTMRETQVRHDPPTAFGYELTELTGPMKPLVSRVEGEWAFEPVGTGTRITWSWIVHPAGALGRGAMPVFGRMWRGYAARALAHLEELLLQPPS